MPDETASAPSLRRPYVAPRQGVFFAGVLSGLFAGSATGAAAMLHSAALGLGWFSPFKEIAASLYGVSALVGGAGTILIGTALHLLVSVFWAGLFAALVRRNASPGATAWGGLVYGGAVWAVMTYFALPSLNPVLLARVELTPGAWFLGHLLFGACLYGAPDLKQRYEEAPMPRIFGRERQRVGV